MKRSISDHLRILVGTRPEGEVKHKYRPAPTRRRKRRKPDFKNESSKPEYHRDVMQDRRIENPEKVSEPVKEYRKKVRRERKEKGLI